MCCQTSTLSHSDKYDWIDKSETQGLNLRMVTTKHAFRCLTLLAQMKRVAIIVGCIAGFGILILICLFVGIGFLFRVPYPPQPETEHRRRLYLARLGGSDRQFGFLVRTNSGDTPMSARTYTWVDFDYTDPTLGTYHLTWMMRGEHDPGFLRFDRQFDRLFDPVAGYRSHEPPVVFFRRMASSTA